MKLLNFLNLRLVMSLMGFLYFHTFVFAQTTAKTITPTCATLKAGTLVWLETTERVSSNTAIGTVVKMRVRANVVNTEGEVLVVSGALAWGIVKYQVAATYNAPASIVIRPTYISTVDGQNIAVNGDEQTFVGEFVLQNFVVEQAQQFTATTTNNEVIKL
jgi:hypothetical protein